jgi:geranylgeranyl diphosphate synthase type II
LSASSSQNQQSDGAAVAVPLNFRSRVDSLRSLVESTLQQQIISAPWPVSLKAAVEYSLMAGGKRLRPVLVLLANEVCGGHQKDALPAACAIEMIHTYSLIHDDLPSMDNDDYRRGRLTSHKVFGEALAILAGDCLLTLAFEAITSPIPDGSTGHSGTAEALRIAQMTKVLASAAGGAGMVGGQVKDLEAERGSFLSESSGLNLKSLTNSSCETTSFAVESSSQQNSTLEGFAALSSDFGATRADQGNSDENDSNRSAQSRVVELSQIHKMKTGALIAASLELGAISAGAGQSDRDRLRHYGYCIGLAFQIADDLLDVTGDKMKLGKTPGRDVDLGKLTYPSLLGIDESRKKAQQLVDEACSTVDSFGEASRWLKDLAKFIVERDH